MGPGKGRALAEPDTGKVRLAWDMGAAWRLQVHRVVDILAEVYYLHLGHKILESKPDFESLLLEYSSFHFAYHSRMHSDCTIAKRLHYHDHKSAAEALRSSILIIRANIQTKILTTSMHNIFLIDIPSRYYPTPN
jgi:hypothetical protein